ncbi:SNF2 family N-terminal domain-containing protein 12 [Elsinoe fawcettii]|nr:SNF2 family N-terminal domain-containing protein 12 [Elsinoe fawcettii]
MSLPGPHASRQEIEDELIFQETLLESMEGVPDDDDHKKSTIFNIEELGRRLNDLESTESSHASAASDTDLTAPNDSDDSLSLSGVQVRPVNPYQGGIQRKRPAPDSLVSSQSSKRSATERIRQRHLEEEERARARRRIEEADALYAMQLSANGEPSTAPTPAPSGPASGHVFGAPSPLGSNYSLPSHSRGPTSQPPRPSQSTYQTNLYASQPRIKPEVRPSPVQASQASHIKSEAPRVKSEARPAVISQHGTGNSSSDIVDLTGDDSDSPVLPTQWQQRPPPNFGAHARAITSVPVYQPAPQNYGMPGSYPTTMQQLAPGDQNRQRQSYAPPPAFFMPNMHVYPHGTASSSSSYAPIPPPSIYQPQDRPASFFDSMKGAMTGFTEGVDQLYELFNGRSVKDRKPKFNDEWDSDPDSADPAELTEDLKNLMDNIRPDEELPVEERDVEVETMTVKLKPYQGAGLTWLQNMEEGTNKGGILADDMGLGKTVQAIALMTTRPSPDPANKTTLIICPVALLRQWKEEIKTKLKRGRPSMSVYIHHGPQKKKTHQELRAFDVVLTSFGTIGSEARKRARFEGRKEQDSNTTERPDEKCIFIAPVNKWYRVILDEAQNVKNRNTQSSRGVCQLSAEYRLCMTGTPMMNSVDELYSLIKFLRIRPYNSWTKFNFEFSRPLKAKSDNHRSDAMKRLQALLKAILLRRHKKSKINGKPILILPERIVEQTPAEFSQEEKDFYKALELQQRVQFNKYVRAGTVGKSYAHILVMLLRLRQACCHPHLVKDFGVQMAADISEDDMVKIAESLDPMVVERIKNSNGEFECPVCYDAVDNPAIFVPCGHDTCADCYIKIKEAASSGEYSGVAENKAKCPNCRGEIDPKQVIDYETFKKVHLEQLDEQEVAAAENVYSAKTGSETETDSEATESEDEGDDVNDSSDEDEDETESETESLSGFIVNNDAGDEEDEKPRSKGKKPAKFMRKGNELDCNNETESEDEAPKKRNKGKKPVAAIFRRPGTRPGGIAFDSDDEDTSNTLSDSKAGDIRKSSNPLADAMNPDPDNANTETSLVLSDKKKRSKKHRSKKSRESKSKSKKAKGKAPAQPKKKRAQQKTIAELKKLATRNKAAKKEYLERIRKDFIDSAKISKCVELLRNIIETTDEKIIVFSQWTSLLDLVEIPVDEAGWAYTRYDGSMPAKSRADAVDEFKDPTRRVQMRLMLVSLKAGNAGLNLNCASQVIILDPFWNPYIEEQAIDRAHRLGQEREVRVHRLLVEETVEDRILKLQEDKRAMINEALDEGAAQRLSRLSQAELGYLFGVRGR